MTRKQQILSSLTKASLNAIAREHEVKGAFHMYTEDLVRVLSRMRSVRLKDILKDMFLQDLKIICQNIGTSDKGNKKADLVDRLLGHDKKFVPEKTTPIKKPKHRPVSNKKTIRNNHKYAETKIAAGTETTHSIARKREVGMVEQTFAPRARIVVRDIDKVLYTQLIIARMGEKELMNWWNTDIAHEMGGADFLGRLLGKTMAPLSAGEGILRAAYMKEMQTINEMPNNDTICTLFRPEPEVAIGIEERYRHFKRYPESLPDDIAKILDPKKDWSSHQLAELIRSDLSPESKGTSFGMEIDKPEGLGVVEIMATMASIIKSNEKGRYVLAYYRKD